MFSLSSNLLFFCYWLFVVFYCSSFIYYSLSLFVIFVMIFVIVIRALHLFKLSSYDFIFSVFSFFFSIIYQRIPFPYQTIKITNEIIVHSQHFRSIMIMFIVTIICYNDYNYISLISSPDIRVSAFYRFIFFFFYKEIHLYIICFRS